MALPLAHATGGYLVYEALRPIGPHRPALLILAVALANAPDLDFVPGLLAGRPGAWHRGATHSIVAALGVAAVAWMAVRRRCSAPARIAALAGVAWASHLVIDFLTADAEVPPGVPFLWPLSARTWLASHTLLEEVPLDRSGSLGFLRGLFTPAAARVWFLEALGLLAAVTGLQALRLARRRIVVTAGPASRP